MMSHSQFRARSALAAIAAAAFVGTPPSYAAERPPRPDETAAAAVYREFLPTATGARPSAGSDPVSAGIPLSPEASAAVSAAKPAQGETAGPARGETLERVATAPQYGAPERRLPPPRDAADREALPSTLEAVSTTESGRLVALALALLGIAALLGGAALRRRRVPT